MKTEAIILAAGEGTRMRSALPKVLHPLAGKPLLQRVLEAALALQPARCHIIIGPATGEMVKAALSGFDIHWVMQDEQLGTGHAVLQAMPAVADDSTVLTLLGDVPLIDPAALRSLTRAAAEAPALLTAVVEDSTGYGRVLRDAQGAFQQVVEERDASDQQRRVKEINTGIIAAPAALLQRCLPRLDNRNAQGHYYLPDVLKMAASDGLPVATQQAAHTVDILGVNDRLQLNNLEREYQLRAARRLLREGATLADARRIDIRGELICGKDVFIDANTVFEGRVRLGDGARVGANCVLIDCEIGDGVNIHPFCHIEGAAVAADCSVGPYARLRPAARLAAGAKVGNFVEIKEADIGPGSKVNHLSYIGDCEMGAGVNIGAGTITCNYDGAEKHRTRIGDGAFIGSNSTLVAPLEIGADAFTGAGSTVTSAVGDKQLAVGRGRQRNIDGWRRPRRVENQKKKAQARESEREQRPQAQAREREQTREQRPRKQRKG